MSVLRECGGNCQGRVLVIDDLSDEDFIAGRCDQCAAEFSISALKAKPEVRRERRLAQAGLPSLFTDQPFLPTEENASVLFSLRGFVRDFGAFLVERRAWERLPGTERERQPSPKCPAAPALFGKVGRGKTHALVALCSRLICEADASVAFHTARGLLRELQDFDGAAPETWQRALSVDVLALDDIGAQQQTDWRLDQLADLIDARYARDRPVLVATNFPPSMWADMLDARTASRLREMCVALELKGPDRRQARMEA